MTSGQLLAIDLQPFYDLADLEAWEAAQRAETERGGIA
jgi:hypothetical protein